MPWTHVSQVFDASRFFIELISVWQTFTCARHNFQFAEMLLDVILFLPLINWHAMWEKSSHSKCVHHRWICVSTWVPLRIDLHSKKRINIAIRRHTGKILIRIYLYAYCIHIADVVDQFDLIQFQARSTQCQIQSGEQTIRNSHASLHSNCRLVYHIEWSHFSNERKNQQNQRKNEQNLYFIEIPFIAVFLFCLCYGCLIDWNFDRHK